MTRLGRDLGRFLKDEIEVGILFPKAKGVKHVTDSKKIASTRRATEGKVGRFLRPVGGRNSHGAGTLHSHLPGGNRTDGAGGA